ncbi:MULTISPECIES: Gfo/Idh/MocA family oxidoreductase [unclassified Chelatococcus]|uniref:Gfo/Idh/MocA family protein n=1 Tax=unclassified Chelatococcus TaxID=2638111 RepID=UPI001BD0FA6D|nr:MULTISPECIES: Gfo/Idh/MocA family oxidoreductase [unclassified Chelatococcus]CAH1654585.1 Oxidoreductase [Hyphomicrobiales bacterium]MBS7742767.1 Gfo/Idh/MocA family oxidoreductase [Chelatococcus sp. HY11]MBX3542115.1 Gfo/Idh/MocA family oxidoreductase [Chelatococcus sp.]MCO5075670.1 Gfo/Idh/MocA family oxidoreductase [Chelatococcus sp.]CAH1694972.1 Oxidoreductase [Hyphomicrobiales bacterium]
MTAPVSLAIVGFGRWGKVLVDSVQGKSDTVRFVTAVGRDPARIAGEAAERGLSVYGSLAEVLAAPAIDGIVLATPHSQHAGQIIACAEAGKPVLVEKPFTLTRGSAQDALETAARCGTLVAAAHNRRFLEPVAALKRLIAAGKLGTILHIETNFSGNVVGRYKPDAWRVAPGESPAGGLAGSGIHHIDSIIHLDGPITEVYALTSRRVHAIAMDDTAAILFRMASGATASLLTMTATASTYSIRVFGTDAKAEVNGLAEKRGSETLVITRTNGDREEQAFPASDIERAELEAFAAAIRGVAPYPVSPAEILNGVAAFEAVSLSVDRHAPVTL